jgi:hypothetical protein
MSTTRSALETEYATPLLARIVNGTKGICSTFSRMSSAIMPRFSTYDSIRFPASAMPLFSPIVTSPRYHAPMSDSAESLLAISVLGGPVIVSTLISAAVWRAAPTDSCPFCGYSKVGVSDEAACPECGQSSNNSPSPLVATKPSIVIALVALFLLSTVNLFTIGFANSLGMLLFIMASNVVPVGFIAAAPWFAQLKRTTTERQQYAIAIGPAMVTTLLVAWIDLDVLVLNPDAFALFALITFRAVASGQIIVAAFIAGAIHRRRCARSDLRR